MDQTAIGSRPLLLQHPLLYQICLSSQMHVTCISPYLVVPIGYTGLLSTLGSLPVLDWIISSDGLGSRTWMHGHLILGLERPGSDMCMLWHTRPCQLYIIQGIALWHHISYRMTSSLHVQKLHHELVGKSSFIAEYGCSPPLLQRQDFHVTGCYGFAMLRHYLKC